LTAYPIISTKPFFAAFFCGNPSTTLRSSKKSHRKTLPAGRQGYYSLPKKNRGRLFSGAAMVNGCTTIASAFTIRKVIFNSGIIKFQVFRLYAANIFYPVIFYQYIWPNASSNNYRLLLSGWCKPGGHY
jgi:hypothetical protein